MKLKILLFISFVPFGLFAQMQIKGTVTSADDGQPLPGATVLVVGTSNGTTTDFDGHYSLKNVNPNAHLAVTYIGFVKSEVPINGQSIIDVVLKTELEQLDEVVLVGYGTVKKSDLTGSVSSIKSEDFNQGVNASVGDAIIGRVPGVRITQASAEPSGAMSIQIRGVGSVTAGSEPLYVVDGLPIDNFQGTTSPGSGFSGTRTPRNPLSSINPSDIESVEVLKDASATAIYGARGANGVILITTKQGSSGKLKVNYHSSVGINQITGKIDVLKPEDYKRILNEIIDEGGGNPEQLVGDIQNGGTDWQDEITRDAWVQSHNLSISGGSEKTVFYTSLNYLDQQGILLNSGFKRQDIRFNLNHTVNEKFKLGLNFTTSYNVNQFGSHGSGGNENAGALHSSFHYDPTLSVYDGEGNYNRSEFITLDNPVALATEQESKSDGFRTLGSMFGEYFIVPNWNIKLNIGGDVQNVRRDSYVTGKTLQGEGVGGIATIGNVKGSNFLIEGTTNYSKKFAESELSLLAGVSRQTFSNVRSDLSASGFPIENLKTNAIQTGAQDTYKISSGKTTNSLLSYIGRINYGLNNKYLLTATFRADGSSRFGENNKFGYFPSGAFAWKLRNEKFLSNVASLSDLKLRTSWGRTGNQDIGNYNSLTTYVQTNDAIFGNLGYTAYQTARLSNPDLKWETTEQYDIGVDFGFWRNRLTGTFDYFTRTTKDMLIQLPIPGSVGFTSTLRNVGKIRNSGIEFSLKSVNLNKGFKWETTINGSTLQNEVLSLGDLPEIIGGKAISKPGEPLNSFYGYEILGVWQTNDDLSVTDDPVGPGMLKYRDVNGDRVVNADDLAILGNSFPEFSWGLDNQFSYSGISLSVFFEGVHGIQMMNENIWQTYSPTNFRRNKIAEPFLNRWTVDNPSNTYPSFVSDTQGNKGVNNYSIEDASYIKLRSIKLGYDIPTKNIRPFNSMNVYLSGQNLLTITDYTGYDPSSNSYNNPSLKVDYSSYPSSRTIVMGVELEF